MRVETMGRSVSVRSRKPLVVRGGLARTFGSLASFLAVSFLFCGSICWRMLSRIRWTQDR